MIETEEKAQKTGLKQFLRRLSIIFWGVYFVQKMSNHFEGLSKIPVKKILRLPEDKGGFGLLPDKAGAFMTDSGLGWYIKALFGPITDNLPILGYRRKSWLIISSLLAAIAWFYVTLFGTSTVTALLTGLMIVNIFVAFSDVVCDGLMIQNAQGAEEIFGMAKGTANRPLQTSQWQGALTAVLISAIAGGIIAQFFALKTAAFISGIFPLILIIGVALFVKEEKVSWEWKRAIKGFVSIGLIVMVAFIILWMKKQPPETLLKSWEWFISPIIVIGSMLLVVRVPKAVIIPLVFMFLWNVNPLNSDAQYFYQYFTEHNQSFVQVLNEKSALMDFLKEAVIFLKIADAETIKESGMQEIFFGSVLMTVMALFFVIATITMRKWLTRAPLYKIFVWCIVGQIIAACCFAAYPILKSTSPSFIILCGAGFGFLGFFATLSLLMFAAEKTPKTDQASIFAFMMGLANMGTMIGSERIGGKIYTLAAGVQEVGGKMVATNPHQGFATILLFSLIYLGSIFVVVHFLKQKGYIGSEVTSKEE